MIGYNNKIFNQSNVIKINPVVTRLTNQKTLKVIILKFLGIGTCFAFRPDDERVLLVGTDAGIIFQCTTASTTFALIK